MADSKISALTAVSSVAATDEFAVNQGGTSKKASAAQIKSFVRQLTYKSADTIRANTTTLAADPHLSITVESGGVYLITGHLAFDPGGTLIAVGATGTATVAGHRGTVISSDGGNGFVMNDSSSFIGGAGNYDAGIMDLNITVEFSSAGTFAIAFAQSSSSASGCTLYKYSTIRADKIN